MAEYKELRKRIEALYELMESSIESIDKGIDRSLQFYQNQEVALIVKKYCERALQRVAFAKKRFLEGEDVHDEQIKIDQKEIDTIIKYYQIIEDNLKNLKNKLGDMYKNEQLEREIMDSIATALHELEGVDVKVEKLHTLSDGRKMWAGNYPGQTDQEKAELKAKLRESHDKQLEGIEEKIEKTVMERISNYQRTKAHEHQEIQKLLTELTKIYEKWQKARQYFNKIYQIMLTNASKQERENISRLIKAFEAGLEKLKNLIAQIVNEFKVFDKKINQNIIGVIPGFLAQAKKLNHEQAKDNKQYHQILERNLKAVIETIKGELNRYRSKKDVNRYMTMYYLGDYIRDAQKLTDGLLNTIQEQIKDFEGYKKALKAQKTS